MIRPLWTSPQDRFVWAQRLGGGAELSRSMVRANIQYRLTLYLEGRARADRAGTCDALSVDNVPAYFPYLVFGQEWITAREGQCRYNASTSMHEISGSCEDMVPLTGTSCQTTCVGLNGSSDPATSDGLLVVKSAGTLAEMTLRWTPKRPGVLLIVFGGFTFFGPPDDNGKRGDAIWSSTRNTRGVAHRAASRPSAGPV